MSAPLTDGSRVFHRVNNEERLEKVFKTFAEKCTYEMQETEKVQKKRRKQKTIAIAESI